MNEYMIKVKAIQWRHGNDIDWIKESKDSDGFYGMYHEWEGEKGNILVVPDGDWIVEFCGVRRTFTNEKFKELLEQELSDLMMKSKEKSNE